MTKKIILSIILIATNFSFANSSFNRQYDISNIDEFSKEIIYLISKENKDEDYKRIIQYISKNAEKKGHFVNNLILYKTGSNNEDSRLKIIIDKINKEIVTLKNDNIPKNGDWSGQAGHSNFILTGHTKEYNKSEVFEIAPNGVPFEYGYPNFEAFRIGQVFNLINPTGSFPHDYSKMIDLLILNKTIFNGNVFSDKSQIDEYLYLNNAKFHYSLHSDSIELIPNQVYSIINYEIPHISKRQ